MKKSGFSPLFAGALEAVASSGGAILPPVMGATAFLVADFVGVPYLTVAVAAVIPALLYYFSLWFYVDCETRKMGLKKTVVAAKHDRRYYLKHLYMILPMIVLVIMLLEGFSTTLAVIVAIASTLVVSAISNPRSLTPKNLIQMLEQSGRTAVSIAVPLACASIVVASIHLSGTGLKMTTMIMRASGNSLPLAMLLTMLVTIFLGMGLPTPAAYTIVAIFAPTALIQLGVPMLAAPPVLLLLCLPCSHYSSRSACSICWRSHIRSQSQQDGTLCRKAWHCGLCNPLDFHLFSAIADGRRCLGNRYVFVTATVGVYELVSGMQGYCFDRNLGWPLRVVFVIASFGLIIPGTITDIIGVIPLAGYYVYHFLKRRQEKHSA